MACGERHRLFSVSVQNLVQIQKKMERLKKENMLVDHESNQSNMPWKQKIYFKTIENQVDQNQEFMFLTELFEIELNDIYIEKSQTKTTTNTKIEENEIKVG